MFKKVLGAVILAASLAACAVPPANEPANPSVQQRAQVSDATLEINVNQTLDAVLPTKTFAHRAYVVVWNNKTLLLGEAKTSDLAARIDQTVRQVYGVNEVINRLKVNPQFNPSILTAANDTRITGQVKSLLLATKTINSLHYKVVTEGGDVYLLTAEDPTQAGTAAQIAARVGGVKSVNIIRK